MATGTTQPIPAPGEIWQPEARIDYEQFVTEDDKPVDSVYSERQHSLLTTALIDSWPGPGTGRPFWVCTDVGLFYAVNSPPFAPDVLLSLDVSLPTADLKKKENRSYYIWKYGKAPDALVEVVSDVDGGELTTKLKGYARLGATYYIVWDPFLFLGDKALYCFALQEGEYKPCEPWFARLGLGVKTWEGVYGGMLGTYLRWCDRDGRLIPTGGERADQERQRADEMRQRADEMQQRADEEKQRADKLAEKLRAAGIDPDKP